MENAVFYLEEYSVSLINSLLTLNIELLQKKQQKRKQNNKLH